jgi:hypothetical protein
MIASPGERIMRIQELVQMILCQMPTQNIARFLSVNSLFWAEGVPLVWQDLDGIEHLVAVGFLGLLKPLMENNVKVRNSKFVIVAVVYFPRSVSLRRQATYVT